MTTTRNTAPKSEKQAASRWSEAEVAKLIELWSTELSNADIAKKLNRHESAVAVKASRINLPRRATLKTQNPKARMRPCLRCSTPFHSAGPGNRFCDPCKESSDWQNGGDYYATVGGV